MNQPHEMPGPEVPPSEEIHGADVAADRPRPESAREEHSTGRWATRLSLRQAKRLVVLVLGMSVMLLGICLLVLPGPGLVLMAGALAILGTEFAIARRWLVKLRRFSNDSVKKLRPRGEG